jgi:hypothetical protein
MVDTLPLHPMMQQYLVKYGVPDDYFPTVLLMNLPTPHITFKCRKCGGLFFGTWRGLDDYVIHVQSSVHNTRKYPTSTKRKMR